jgi:hypothetical protein
MRTANGMAKELPSQRRLSALRLAAHAGWAITAAWLGAGSVLFGAGEWIRPKSPDDALVWGRTDGVVFGIRSAGGMRGPRGLIRIGVPGANGGPAELVNFVAVEPVISGFGSRFSRMGFSELDMSSLDPGERGKRIWVARGEFAGELRTLAPLPSLVEILGGRPKVAAATLQTLSVRLEVEPFQFTKAHVYVVATMVSDQPNEVRFAVFHHPDSESIEELTTTATMGNYERLRHLWLKDRVVDSRDTPGAVEEFRDLENFPLPEMLRTGDGDAIVFCTTNESDPGLVEVAGAPSWDYRAPKLTQYWRVPAHEIQPDLRVKVNVRRKYWASRIEVPGGMAFENFEVRQRYVPGQAFIFGLTPKTPQEFRPEISHLATRDTKQARLP